MHEKNERNKKLYEVLAGYFEVPQNIVWDIPVFTIRGRHEIEIIGCTGILTYDSKRIVLSIGRGKESFCVTGDSLMLSDFREKVLYVRGNIRTASFDTGEGEEDRAEMAD